MSWKRKVSGGILGFVGFMLSPLSWWNDLYVNVPLALAFAWLVGLLRPNWFAASWVVGYWLTNALGFVLMHKGARDLISRDAVPGSKDGSASRARTFWSKPLIRDLVISLVYTALIVVLVKFGAIKPVEAYFERSH